MCDFCREIPLNFISLQCKHDLCITCSANHIQQEVTEEEMEEFWIECPICKTNTEIDEETVQGIV